MKSELETLVEDSKRRNHRVCFKLKDRDDVESYDVDNENYFFIKLVQMKFSEQ